MHTWLVVFRGDPAEGGVPIGIVNDRELVLAAVRSAWAAFRQLYAEERHDPALRAGVEGMDRRLRLAAAELGCPSDTAASAAPPSATPWGRLGTPPAEAICARRGCGARFTLPTRRRGDEQIYCTRRCCRLASRERRRSTGTQPELVSGGLAPVGAEAGS